MPRSIRCVAASGISVSGLGWAVLWPCEQGVLPGQAGRLGGEMWEIWPMLQLLGYKVTKIARILLQSYFDVFIPASEAAILQCGVI